MLVSLDTCDTNEMKCCGRQKEGEMGKFMVEIFFRFVMMLIKIDFLDKA